MPGGRLAASGHTELVGSVLHVQVTNTWWTNRQEQTPQTIYPLPSDKRRELATWSSCGSGFSPHPQAAG